MTKQILNLGSVANDGTGDTLRQAGSKINDNFDELYSNLDSGLGDAPQDSGEYARYNGTWKQINTMDEAPVDGTPYARRDSSWVSIPSNLESPNDGNVYGRFNAGWLAVTEEANSDGSLYARKDGAWEAVVIPVLDAPADGQIYGRQDSSWVLIDSSADVPEAPNNGNIYARQNQTWLDVTSSLSAVIPEAPTDGKMYGRQSSNWEISVEEANIDSTPYVRYNGGWIDGTPEVVNPPSDGIVYGRDSSTWVEVLTDADSDEFTYARNKSAWVQVTPEAAIDSVPYVRYNGGWIDGTPDVLESPMDSVTYGRYNGTWQEVLTDADSNGVTYARKNGLWTSVPPEAPNIIGAVYGRGESDWSLVTPEAPIDGLPYARQDALWVDMTPEVQEAPLDGLVYARQSGIWVEVADSVGAIGGGGGTTPGGTAETVDRLISTFDSLSANTSLNGVGDSNTFYERTFVVGAAGDFTDIYTAIEYLNSKPESPINRMALVRINLDCTGYDLYDSSPADSVYDGLQTIQNGWGSFIFGPLQYRVRIEGLRLDSSTSKGTIPDQVSYGPQDPQFTIGSGVIPSGNPSFADSGGLFPSVQFKDCNFSGRLVSVHNSYINFHDCGFSSTTEITAENSNIVLRQDSAYVASGPGKTIPLIYAKNTTVDAVGTDVSGVSISNNSTFNILTNRDSCTIGSLSADNNSSVIVNAGAGAWPHTEVFVTSGIFLTNNSTMKSGTSGGSQDITTPDLKIIQGSALYSGKLTFTNTLTETIHVKDGSSLYVDSYINQDSTGLLLDRNSYMYAKIMPFWYGATIDGTSTFFDSQGESGLIRSRGSRVHYDPAF